ncbi:hypothetical protein COCON_G00178880 [Conger conger]|uniref:Uncharacterized protein n=1 Tax=Conger conger TaxID=82655 RepID=A0A9Q1D5A9_CONCO|nr:hypothetical protein COCON_G00178880 [Conger conger]
MHKLRHRSSAARRISSQNGGGRSLSERFSLSLCYDLSLHAQRTKFPFGRTALSMCRDLTHRDTLETRSISARLPHKQGRFPKPLTPRAAYQTSSGRRGENRERVGPWLRGLLTCNIHELQQKSR